MKKLFYIPLLYSLSASIFAKSDLENRVEQLELAQIESLKNSSPFNTFTSKSITIGGYFNSTYTQNFGKHTKVGQSFDEVELGLMLVANLSDKLNVFSHIELELETNLENKNAPWREFNEVETQIEPEVIYLEYAHSQKLQFQLGSIISPFGISNTDHYDYFRWQNEKPLGLRTSSGKFVFFSDYVSGANVFGHTKIGNFTLDHAFYTGSNRLDHTSLAYGSRLVLNSKSKGFKLGFSYQGGSRGEGDNTGYHGLGGDLYFKYKRFEIRTEYIYASVDNFNNPSSYYIEPWVYIIEDKFLFFTRYDYIDDTVGIHTIDHDQDSTTAKISDPFEKVETSVGFNYLPWPHWRNSIAITKHKYKGTTKTLNGQSRDYNSVEFGTVLSF